MTIWYGKFFTFIVLWLIFVIHRRHRRCRYIIIFALKWQFTLRALIYSLLLSSAISWAILKGHNNAIHDVFSMPKGKQCSSFSTYIHRTLLRVYYLLFLSWNERNENNEARISERKTSLKQFLNVIFPFCRKNSIIS